MKPISVQQQVLDATLPGRNANREEFVRHAPEHVLQHIVDRIHGECDMAESQVLNWMIQNYQLSFSEHDTKPLVKARDFDLMNSITYSSDLIPRLGNFRLHPSDIATFISVTVADMRDLWELPINRENVRARLIHLAIRRQRPVTKEDYSSDLFGYVRDNLTVIEDALEQIFEMKLASISEVKGFIDTHGAIRTGVL